MDKYSFILGCRISDFRRLNGFTQKDFAARVGVSLGFISKLECGLKSPTIETLIKIANILGVPVDWLFHDAASTDSWSKTWLIAVAQLSRRHRMAQMRKAAAALDEICEKIAPVHAFIQESIPEDQNNIVFWKALFLLQMAEAIEKERKAKSSEAEKSGNATL